GIPLGAWFAYTVNWRIVFAGVTVLALTAAMVLLRLVPRSVAVPRTSLAMLVEIAKKPRYLLAVSFGALVVGGTFGLYTYFAPFLEDRHGLGRNGVTISLLCSGLCGFFGNPTGGHASDRFGFNRALFWLAIMQVILLPLLTLTHLPLVGTVGLLCFWNFV